ncbi:unnamed protein product [Camellia sinensis]
MMVFARSMWLLGLIYFLGLGLVFGLNFGESLKVPFRVNDVLSALPRQISWPVLNNLHSAVDLLPSFVGSVSPTNGSIEWKGVCFFDNEARLEFTGGDRGLGGGVLHLKNLWVELEINKHSLVLQNHEEITAASFQCSEKKNTAMGCLDTSKGGKLLHCIAASWQEFRLWGGNVGHLRKLLGIESSSQGVLTTLFEQFEELSAVFFYVVFGLPGLKRRCLWFDVILEKYQGHLPSLVDDKYQYSCDDKDNRVHGWICSNPAVGFWMITPSDEFRTCGPVKQDLTSHVGPTTLSMFFSTHYAGDNQIIKLRDGEPWKKVFGPVLIYLNSVSVEEDALTLWEDAKEQMLIETQSWPYDFPLSEDFPHADQRGTVSG